ncbi:polysaccharide export protein [bacterium]|nr:polysaccharide export protein [bacterium]
MKRSDTLNAGRRPAAFVAGLAALALAGCASATGVAGGCPPAQPGDVATVGDNFQYKLASGDQLRVTVFGEESLSGEFSVDGQGAVSLPLVGEIDAQGLTVRQFQRALETKLKDGYLLEPRVSAEVMNYRPFYIYGEVNNAGNYPYVEGLTVQNAIAMAGDFTYRANRRQICMKSTDTTVEREVELTPNLLVRPGDTIRVRERIL